MFYNLVLTSLKSPNLFYATVSIVSVQLNIKFWLEVLKVIVISKNNWILIIHQLKLGGKLHDQMQYFCDLDPVS